MTTTNHDAQAVDHKCHICGKTVVPIDQTMHNLTITKIKGV